MVLEVGYMQLVVGMLLFWVSKAFSKTLQCFTECFAHSKEQHAMFSVQLHVTSAQRQFTGIRILEPTCCLRLQQPYRMCHNAPCKLMRQKRKDCAFRRQFNEKPSIIINIPGCPGRKLRVYVCQQVCNVNSHVPCHVASDPYPT